MKRKFLFQLIERRMNMDYKSSFNGEIVANCIAPRPFMMIAPLEDEDMPKEGVNDLLKIHGHAYEYHGGRKKEYNAS